MKRVAVGIMILMVFAVAGSYVSASTSLSDSSADYYHPYPTNVIPGDIILGHSPSTDWLIPGYWTHAGIIAWYNSSINDWEVIEAYYYVRVTPLKTFMKRYDAVVILRVNTSNYIRERAVLFASEQLGKPYSFEWWTKKVYADAYYCSELVWASYMWASNGTVDIDANPGWTWTYLDGVAPQEIYDSNWTYVVYYDYS